MKRIISLISVAALLAMQGCRLSESELKPQGPSGVAYKVQIYSDISQQPASKVAVDEGFCTGDQVGVYIVNYDGEIPGTLKLEDNQADNVRFSYNENGDWVSDYDVFYKDNDTKVDFYGYYPYADPTSIEAYPFEVAKDQSKEAEHGQMATYEASDFLWAKTAKVTPTSSKVMLTFRHMMSSARVRFTQGSGWTDAAEYAAAAKDVLVNSTIRKSIIDLSTGVVTPQGDAPLDGIDECLVQYAVIPLAGGALQICVAQEGVKIIDLITRHGLHGKVQRCEERAHVTVDVALVLVVGLPLDVVLMTLQPFLEVVDQVHVREAVALLLGVCHRFREVQIPCIVLVQYLIQAVLRLFFVALLRFKIQRVPLGLAFAVDARQIDHRIVFAFVLGESSCDSCHILHLLYLLLVLIIPERSLEVQR